MRDVAVIVSCHELEEPYALDITVSSARRVGDVFVGYDRFVPQAHLDVIYRYAREGGVSAVITNTRGIGNNRQILCSRVLELGYRYVVQSDCHVRFVGNIERTYSAYRFIAVDDSGFLHGPPPGSPVYYGYFHQYHDLYKNCFIWDSYSGRIMFFNEPVVVFDARLLRHLADMQCGYIYLLPGYGFEVSDVTLSLARLGYMMRAVPTILHHHRINRGGETRWTARWDQEQNILHQANLTIYTTKHGFPNKYYSHDATTRYRDRIECGLQLARAFRYTLEDIYRMINAELKITCTS